MNENAILALKEAGLLSDLLGLLPTDVPFDVKTSQGDGGFSLPLSGSHHSPAAMYVDRNCLWVALDPDVARRFSDLTGVKIADPSGNLRTWRLVVHSVDARRPEAAPHLREAVKQSLARSLTQNAASLSTRNNRPGKSAAVCPTHFEGVPVGTGVCSRCAEE